MKLAKVILSVPIRLPAMAQGDVEVTAEDCPGLRYDEKRGVVIFGDTNRERPREQVVEWERDNEQLVCPECDEEFANPQGLGGHRRRAHGVTGEGKGAA